VSLQLRHEYAVDLPHGLPAGNGKPTQEFPAHIADGCAPRPAQIRQVRAGVQMEGRKTPVPRVLLSVTLTGPAPSGSTGHVPALSGLLPPSPAPPGSGCPQLHSLATTRQAAKVSHLHSNHSASRRKPLVGHTRVALMGAAGPCAPERQSAIVSPVEANRCWAWRGPTNDFRGGALPKPCCCWQSRTSWSVFSR
jgi:hypothetical protein